MKTRTIHLIMLLVDIFFITLCFYILLITLKDKQNYYHYFSNLYIYILISWIFVYILFISDITTIKTKPKKLLKHEINKYIYFIAFVSVVILVIPHNQVSRSLYIGLMSSFFVVKLITSALYYHYVNLNYNNQLKPVIIIGNNKLGFNLHQYFIKNKNLGVESIGILGEGSTNQKGNVIGKTEDFQLIYNKVKFQEAYVTIPINKTEQIKYLIMLCEKNGVKLNIVPNYTGINSLSFKVHKIGEAPLLQIRNIPLDDYSNRFWKRAFDLFFSTILIILLLPVMIVIVILIKIDSKGPILYTPTRLGAHNVPFKIYKFRTMTASDPNVDSGGTILNDPRITKLGKLLRKYSLDELPQIFNVLNNEMSIVGPRPHRIMLNKYLQDKSSSYMMRHVIKPGITGWAQVNGWRGPTETRIQRSGRTLHDLWYLENWTFWLDMYIIFLTMFGKKTKTNAY